MKWLLLSSVSLAALLASVAAAPTPVQPKPLGVTGRRPFNYNIKRDLAARNRYSAVADYEKRVAALPTLNSRAALAARLTPLAEDELPTSEEPECDPEEDPEPTIDPETPDPEECEPETTTPDPEECEPETTTPDPEECEPETTTPDPEECEPETTTPDPEECDPETTTPDPEPECDPEEGGGDGDTGNDDDCVEPDPPTGDDDECEEGDANCECSDEPDSPPTLPPTSPPTGAACAKTVTIVSGDYCSKVASAANITLEKFYELNPDLDTECQNLHLGQEYCVA